MSEDGRSHFLHSAASASLNWYFAVAASAGQDFMDNPRVDNRSEKLLSRLRQRGGLGSPVGSYVGSYNPT